MDDNFVKIECCECGILFAVSATFKKNLKENKQIFYCPNGHAQSFSKSKSEEMREAMQSVIDIKNGEIKELFVKLAEAKKVMRKKKATNKRTIKSSKKK